jgi:peptide-methionine (S)-S-oxide reductase
VSGATERATLAGGCFWCLEAVFLELKGVTGVQSGYAGGKRPNPSYEQVCSGATGHAEAVQVSYDPEIVTYKELLDVFFTIHDPTTLNRQGGDKGTQYRSAVFFESPEQERLAKETIAGFTAARVWDDPIVSEVAPLEKFWPAEEYHNNYFARNPQNPYCSVVIAPKVSKARKLFLEKLAK